MTKVTHHITCPECGKIIDINVITWLKAEKMEASRNTLGERNG